jgi:glycosyltransferase involved in cell wall biosynthesis
MSVIVPVLNGGLVLSDCLNALSRSDYPDYEVLVVDDCSNDLTVQIAESHGARCIQNPHTMGPGGARNVGAQYATGDVLVFVDADVVLPPDGLRLMAEDFLYNPQIVAVFGSYDDAPACTAFISQYKNLLHHYIHQTSRESASTFWAGFGAIRKPVFEKFGGFDATSYSVPSIEDVALGFELVHSGLSILLDKRLRVKHLKEWSWFSLLRTDIFDRAVPWTRLILNTHHLPDDLNFDYTARTSSILVGLLTLICVLLPIAFLQPWPDVKVPLLATATLIAVLLLYLNRRVYRFFVQKRGWWFAARAVLAHWAYYLYGGVTFIVVAAEHLVLRAFSEPRAKSDRRPTRGNHTSWVNDPDSRTGTK